jgi:hypothetical protein
MTIKDQMAKYTSEMIKRYMAGQANTTEYKRLYLEFKALEKLEGYDRGECYGMTINGMFN